MARPRKDAITSDSRREDGTIFEQKPVALPEKKKPEMRLYVSPHQKQGFKVPVRDNNGNIMYQVNPLTNIPLLINGNRVPIVKDYNFLCQSNNIKRGCLSYFETDEPDVIAVLDALAADPSNKIITEEEYLKNQDPGKYEIQKKLDAKEAELQTVKEENELNKSIIDELNEKLARFEGKKDAA